MATQTLPVGTGDSMFVYVYVDPANKPNTIMLSWYANSWEHRAYWGANNIKDGADNTASRR